MERGNPSRIRKVSLVEGISLLHVNRPLSYKGKFVELHALFWTSNSTIVEICVRNSKSVIVKTI